MEFHSVSKLTSFKGMISDQNEGRYEEPIALRKKINEHDAAVVQECLQSIDMSSYIVDKNYEQLCDSISEYETYPGSLQDSKLNNLSMEIVLHFTNFVNSAKSRENHTRDYVLPRLMGLTKKDLKQEYQEAVPRYDVDLYGYFFHQFAEYIRS